MENQRSGDPTVLTETVAVPEAIRDTVAKTQGPISALRERLLGDGVRRVFLVGNGTSLYSCEFAEHWYRTQAAPSDPCVTALSAGQFRYHPPALDSRDLVLAVSASGEFRDVVGLLEEVRGRVPTVAVTQRRESSVGGLATEVIVAGGGDSEFPVMTKSFASTASATVMVALALAADTNVLTDACDTLLDAAERAEWAISAAEEESVRVAAFLDGITRGFTFGTGGGAAAALEAALKIKEMALLHVEGAETWEAESGSSTVVRDGSFVLALRPEGAGEEATVRLAGLSAEWGAHVVEVAPQRSLPQSAVLAIPPGTPDMVAPLVCVPPVVMMAYHLATARGLDPNRPNWTARYTQQGLTHVVGSGDGGQDKRRRA